MKRIIKTLTIITILGLMVNCSEQEFSSVPSDTCKDINQDFGDGSCKPDSEGLLQLSYSLSVCKTDILFVVDNSGSMSTEQQELANRFPGFLNAIDELDYNISVTTTDISFSKSNPKDPQNGEGTFWDGKLIAFPNGKKFISNSTANAQNEFEQNVQRPESLTCDNGGECPSGDERGIYAATLAVENAAGRGNLGTDKFIRPSSHLAVVILSDENERSDGGNIAGYPLEPRDRPENLVKAVKAELGVTKVFSVHPIIVQSGDTACNTEQNNQQNGLNRPRYATLYEDLASPSDELKELGNIVPGSVGSICAGNYTPVLEEIGNVINKNVGIIQLACNPENLIIKIGGVLIDESEYEVDSSNRLVITSPPSCLALDVDYKCLPGEI